MMGEKKDEERDEEKAAIKDCYILFNPIRWQIVQKLKESQDGMYITQLVKSIGGDKKEITFHSLTLQQYDFISSEYGIIEPLKEHSPAKGKIGNIFQLTDKGAIAHEAIKEILPELVK